MRAVINSVLLLSMLLMFACAPSDKVAEARIKSFIDENLGPGDSAAAIESFFRENKWQYIYDPFAQRYLATPAEGSVKLRYSLTRKKGMAVWIYVDEGMVLTRIKVEIVYTGF